MTKTTPTIQDMLHELLDSLGFDAMARDVLTETDKPRLQRYARIIVRNSKPEFQYALSLRFKRINLL